MFAPHTITFAPLPIYIISIHDTTFENIKIPIIFLTNVSVKPKKYLMETQTDFSSTQQNLLQVGSDPKDLVAGHFNRQSHYYQ